MKHGVGGSVARWNTTWENSGLQCPLATPENWSWSWWTEKEPSRHHKRLPFNLFSPQNGCNFLPVLSWAEASCWTIAPDLQQEVLQEQGSEEQQRNPWEMPRVKGSEAQRLWWNELAFAICDGVGKRKMVEGGWEDCKTTKLLMGLGLWHPHHWLSQQREKLLCSYQVCVYKPDRGYGHHCPYIHINIYTYTINRSAGHRERTPVQVGPSLCAHRHTQTHLLFLPSGLPGAGQKICQAVAR